MDSSTQSLKQRLITEAQDKLGCFTLSQISFTAGGVASALMSNIGNIYTGVCVDLACGLGFCAEQAAIADMLKALETVIRAIVAVNADGVMAPCGRCRELMMQVNPNNRNTTIFLPGDRSVSLQQLLPDHWL
jgi:cytidine deaminase